MSRALGISILRGCFFLAYVAALAFALIWARETMPLYQTIQVDANVLQLKLNDLSSSQEEIFKAPFTVNQKEIFPLYRVNERPQEGQRKHELIACAFQVNGETLYGPFELLLLTDMSGYLLHVSAIHHSQPLGTDQLFRENSLIFESILMSQDALRNEFYPRPQVLGAPQISAAVAESVREGLLFFDRHASEIAALHPYASELPFKAPEPERSLIGQIIDTINPLDTGAGDEPQSEEF